MKPLCLIDDCQGEVHARGWCWKHYGRWIRGGDPEKMRATPARGVVVDRTRKLSAQCTAQGCEADAKTRDLCHKHYMRWYRTGGLALRRAGGGAA